MFASKTARWRLIKQYTSVVVASFSLVMIVSVSPVVSQEETLPPLTGEQTTTVPDESIFFADVLVRNQPVFQVGSLGELSAIQRAAIINRRIASIVEQNPESVTVTVEPDNPRQIATLRVKNRVIMTVTQTDVEDFGAESVEALAQRWAERLNEALEQPPLAIDVSKRLYTTTRELLRDTVANLPSLVGAIIVIILTWIVAKIVRYIAFRWAQRTEGDSNTEILIGRLSYGAVWVVGSVIALGVFGIDFAALLGALGLTSVAIGFSLKDVLSNYISGVILLAAKPFKINDQVVIDEYEGTITQIQLRATTMKTYDGRVVYIPNQEVFQSSIINNTASPRRRSSIMVGIDYGADIQKAKKVVMGVLNQRTDVESDPKPDVLVQELAASTVNLEARFWVDSRRAGFLATTSNVAQAIKEALETAEIEMPTEIYTIMFRNAPKPLKVSMDGKTATLTNEDINQ